jgi:hypothetical protein
MKLNSRNVVMPAGTRIGLSIYQKIAKIYFLA